jgi:hypothetical protein
MSRINGEKARSAIAKRNRTNRRVKDRALLAQLRQGGGEGSASKKDEQPAEQQQQKSEE